MLFFVIDFNVITVGTAIDNETLSSPMHEQELSKIYLSAPNSTISEAPAPAVQMVVADGSN